MKQTIGFGATEILLPDFTRVDGTRWAVIACDQFTSEPQYWEEAEKLVGDAPSTLQMILPELYLSESEARIERINREMARILREELISHPNAMVALCRTQSDGKLRRGILGAIDLECYDYSKDSTSLIRATEGTILERIPPRVAIRRNAPLELPHVILFIDDPEKTVIEPALESASERAPLYDFDLMLGGGHVRSHLLNDAEKAKIEDALAALITPEAMERRYGDATLAPLLFAVGDGNHSLASAKALYEDIKSRIGIEAAKEHPARYALVEVVNVRDEILEFEPIYRAIFDCDTEDLLRELKETVTKLNGTAAPQTITCITATEETTLTVDHPVHQLTVGTLQNFLSDYSARHQEITVDYIHGEDSLRALAKKPNTVCFLFEGMQKDEFFLSVMRDGALPRKTFSMSHARDKRYYLECRKIQ